MATFDSNDSHIDLRDVTARVDELRSDLTDLESAAEEAEQAQMEYEDAHPDADSEEDASYQALQAAVGAARDALEGWGDADELASLQELLGDLAGYGGDHQWEGSWYPADLIHEDEFVDAMKDLVEDIGDIPNGMPNYVVVDWEATAENLRADYSSVTFDGAEYWYR